jgi:hypothetical protein
MKLPQSFIDVRSFTNDLNTFISSRHFDYSGGVFRVAMTRHNGAMRFAEGCLLLQREKVEAAPKADYGDVLFVEEWIEPLSEAINFLPPFLSGQRSVAGQKVATQFTRTDWHHQDVIEHTMTGWREWRFLSRADFLDRNENFHLTQEPLTRKGLVPYINAGHGIADKLYGNKRWNSISSPYQGQFMTILPETRARLLAGEWRPGSVHIEVEANVPLLTLELQILADVGGRQQSRIVPLQSKSIDEEIPVDTDNINIFLAHESGECLSRTYLPAMFYAFGPQKPTQEVYLRVLSEISNGENDRVEYKTFIEPKDSKEREIVKATIAFANTLGGTIYVGIEDDGTLQGEAALCAAYHMSPDKARAASMSHLRSLIVENVKPVPGFKIDVVEVKQSPVLVMRVEGGNRKPYSNKSHQVWIRKGASDMVPDPQTEFPTESRDGLDFPHFGN